MVLHAPNLNPHAHRWNQSSCPWHLVSLMLLHVPQVLPPAAPPTQPAQLLLLLLKHTHRPVPATCCCPGGYFKDVKSALGYYPQWSSALEFVKAHGSGLNLAEKASLFVPSEHNSCHADEQLACTEAGACCECTHTCVASVLRNLVSPLLQPCCMA